MHRKKPILSRPVAGVTLMELMICVALMALIFGAVGGVQLLSARSAQDLYAESRTRTSRSQAMDQIRFQVMMARIGTLQVADQGRTLRFNNPNLGTGAISRFTLNNGDLLFDEEIGAGADERVIARGLDDINFQILPPGSSLQVRIENTANKAYQRTDEETIQSTIFLRN